MTYSAINVNFPLPIYKIELVIMGVRPANKLKPREKLNPTTLPREWGGTSYDIKG